MQRGQAPLAPYVLERLQERMPTALVSNNYGMTEAGSVYCLMPPGEAVKRPGSVGKPVPPAEILLPTTTANRCHGRGRKRAPADPGAVLAILRRSGGQLPDVGGRLAATGDLGKIDADGYLYIVGRSKDVVIRGGNNIHPTDVEHAIALHPAVREVAVVGLPHPVLGEDLLAVVALRPGAQATAEELREHTLERLAKYKVPRQWEFVDALPRNATGKVVKQQLQQQFADRTPDATDAPSVPS